MRGWATLPNDSREAVADTGGAMFDIATRPLPSDLAAKTGVVFDWRLTQPGRAISFPWTDFSDPSGEPQAYVDVLEVFALEMEPTLQSAVIHSIFTDARAGEDDVLPAGVTDRRGWVGDEFVGDVDSQGKPLDPWGTLLWLYYSGKVLDDGVVLEGARFTVQEGLAWMLRTGVASRVVVTSAWRDDVLVVRSAIYQGEDASPVFDVLWGTTVRRGAAS